MARAIPIQNIYYLLCYAWDKLDQGELVDVSDIPTTELVDLFALVLCDGVRHLARRGLEQGYSAIEDELAGLRGRIDFAQSTRRALFMRGRAHCRYDELTSNTDANRIIKSTLYRLQSMSTIDANLRRDAHQIHRGLQAIDHIALSHNTFHSIRVSSNQRFYRFLLNICELLFECLLVDEQSGNMKFRDFTRDDAKMAKVFQGFLLNFVNRECASWSAKAENISWQAVSETDPGLDYLPRMQTDMSLSRPGEHLIVDSKYYSKTLGTYYDAEKFHSTNLYQLMSYLSNARPKNGAKPSGMLVYPRIDRDLRETYEIQGYSISVCTIDLAQPWQKIDRELRTLFQ